MDPRTRSKSGIIKTNHGYIQVDPKYSDRVWELGHQGFDPPKVYKIDREFLEYNIDAGETLKNSLIFAYEDMKDIEQGTRDKTSHMETTGIEDFEKKYEQREGVQPTHFTTRTMGDDNDDKEFDYIDDNILEKPFYSTPSKFTSPHDQPPPPPTTKYSPSYKQQQQMEREFGAAGQMQQQFADAINAKMGQTHGQLIPLTPGGAPLPGIPPAPGAAPGAAPPPGTAPGAIPPPGVIPVLNLTAVPNPQATQAHHNALKLQGQISLLDPITKKMTPQDHFAFNISMKKMIDEGVSQGDIDNVVENMRIKYLSRPIANPVVNQHAYWKDLNRDFAARQMMNRSQPVFA